ILEQNKTLRYSPIPSFRRMPESSVVSYTALGNQRAETHLKLILVADTIDFVLFIEHFSEAIHCFRLLRPPLSRESRRLSTRSIRIF
ncbi:MAG: hypothetical protein P8101_17760, partial [Candidatus Thiodiazotropha sp.]